MCFQVFHHCACHHVMLAEVVCKLAGDIPFYIKVACPEYKSQTIVTDASCGRGRFYCRRTQEGGFFDQVFNVLDQAEAQMKTVNTRSEAVEAQRIKIETTADDVGLSHTIRIYHPAFKAVSNAINDLEQQRMRATTLKMQACGIISEGEVHYRKKVNYASRGLQFLDPSFNISAGLQCQLLPELRNLLIGLTSGAHEALSSVVTTDLIDASSCGAGAAFTGRRNVYGAAQDDAHPMSRSKPAPQKLEYPGFGAPPATGEDGESITVAKRRVRPVKTPNQNAKQDSESRVRRSTRVRDKKVSYAESDSSTITSREPSPEKSDFSPEKSDATASPPKRAPPQRRQARTQVETPNPFCTTPRRDTSSLSSRIGDWKRRDNVAHTASSQPRPQMPSYSANYPRFSGITNLAQPAAYNAIPSIEHSPGPTFYSRTPNFAPSLQAMPNTNMAYPPSNNQTHMMPNSVPFDNGRGWAMPFNATTSGPNPLMSHQGLQSNFHNGYDNQSSAQTMFNQMSANMNFLSQQQSAGFNTNPFQQPRQAAYDPNWLINTPAFNGPMRTTPQQARPTFQPHTTNLTNYNVPQLAPSMYDKSAPRTYQGMHRSFSANTLLTPPTVPNSTPNSTDPKKRSLPASSPVLPHKRMRLSLPGNTGDDDESIDLTESQSSPSKMPTQAPILAPTPTRFVPPLPDQNEEQDARDLFVREDSDEPNELPRAQDLEGGEVDEGIDWSLLDDGALEG